MKNIVIMGASSGIGRAVAEALASRGMRVGVAARNEKALRELVAKYPGCMEFAVIDITRPGASEALIDLADRLGGMDIYFHASGIGYDNPTLDPETEARYVDTDATGFARMMMTAFKYFLNRARSTEHMNVGSGMLPLTYTRHDACCAPRFRIAAITSVAGTKGIGEMAAYSASKRFDSTYLSALRQLAVRKNLNLSVTDIRPGWTDTPLLHSGERYPLLMKPEDVTREVIRAIVRHPRVAVIDWRWRLLVGAWRLIPDFIWERIGFHP